MGWFCAESCREALCLSITELANVIYLKMAAAAHKTVCETESTILDAVTLKSHATVMAWSTYVRTTTVSELHMCVATM